MKKLLMKCRLDNQPVEIVYLDKNGQLSQRIIFVKRVGEERIIAFCTLRKQQRIFYLENILAVQKCSNLKRYISIQVESTQEYRFLGN